MKRQLGLLLLSVWMSLPAWAIDYTYDVRNRLTAVQYDNGLRITYAYDAAGNITGIASSGAPNPGGCGAANGVATYSVPTTSLCTSGTPSAVTASAATYAWSCVAGSTAYCSAPRNYRILATGGANGTVTPVSQLLAYGSQGTVVVVPASGYQATVNSSCGGNMSGVAFTTAPLSADCTVTATFLNSDLPNSHTLTVNKTGTGIGAISGDVSGINCGSVCAANYTHGTIVRLTAAPWGASRFVGWSGACSGTGSTCSVSVDAAKTVIARFSTTDASNPFGTTIDNKGLFFTTGSWGGGEGVNGWTQDATHAYAGTSSLRSGTIGNGDLTWLDTIVRGPGTLSFAWKVSSEVNHDYLRFYLDDVALALISGEQDWTMVTLPIPPGQHVLAWAYQKDAANSTGADAGWVDSIVVNAFNDVPATSWAVNYINALYSAGITTGCGSGNYCTTQTVTRDQMAAFIIRAKEGEPAACTTAPFSDVPVTNTFCKYIQRMSASGITTGCGGGNYCPSQSVTREQMAAFIIRALEGNPVAGYCGSTPPFGDVPVTNAFCGYIKRMLERNVTSGCGGGKYCPSQTVSRDQMAAFLARAFLGM